MQEHFDLKDCVFLGHSAGAEVSYCLATGIDIKIVWPEYQKFVEEVATYPTQAVFNWNNLALKCHQNVLDLVCQTNDRQTLLESLRSRLIIAATQVSITGNSSKSTTDSGGTSSNGWFPFSIPRLRKTYLSQFSTHVAAMQCLCASYTIPFITVPAFQPFQPLCTKPEPFAVMWNDSNSSDSCSENTNDGTGKHSISGSIASMYEDFVIATEHMLHLDSFFSHFEWAQHGHPEERTLVFWVNKWRWFSPITHWLHADVVKNQNLFDLGYQDALQHHAELAEKLPQLQPASSM